MSEEKGKKNWLTPWIIAGVCIIALLVYLWVLNNRDVSPDPATRQPEAASAPDNSTITSYADFVMDTSNTMSLDHAYTNEALLKLSDAVRTVAYGGNAGNASGLDSVKTLAGMITQDRYETSHANHIRMAADIVVRTLQRVQEQKHPELVGEMVAVKNAALQINPDRLTLDQREQVKGFFRQTAGLLRKMN